MHASTEASAWPTSSPALCPSPRRGPPPRNARSHQQRIANGRLWAFDSGRNRLSLRLNSPPVGRTTSSMSSTCSSPPNGKHRPPSRNFVGHDCHRRKCSSGSRTRPCGACTAPPAPMYSHGMPCANSDRFCDSTSNRFRGASIPVTASGTALRAPEGRRRKHVGRHGTDRHRGGLYPTGVRFTRVLRLLHVSGIGGGSGPPGWAATMLSIRWRTDCPSSGHAPSIAPTPISPGIVYRGRFAGGTAVAVVERTADAFPQRPVLSLPLSHPGLEDAIDTAAHELGCVIT